MGFTWQSSSKRYQSRDSAKLLKFFSHPAAVSNRSFRNLSPAVERENDGGWHLQVCIALSRNRNFEAKGHGDECASSKSTASS